MDTTIRFEVGTKFGNHVVTRVETLEHLGGTYLELIHEPTGARHIHVSCADDCRTFNVTFPTVPRTDNGVAHILEHVVLAGSEKYPVRDPFFSMTSRSVRDFMNAMTFPAATSYPFSTRNDADFWNLLEVYLDATFFPRITESSFLQEGHRLEFTETADPESGLRIKGVVFNEMKGAMAAAGSILGRSIGKALLPGTTFAYNSGGNPEDIPSLTWQELKDFHAVHYHPSNALFYTYGDMDPNQLFARIEELALSRFTKIKPDIAIPVVPPFAEPTRFEASYPLPAGEDTDRKSDICVGWAMPPTDDPFWTLSMKVLEQVLVGNDAAPLKQALIASGLGANLSTGTGFEDGFTQGYFGAGLQGTNPDLVDQIEDLVIGTLTEIADNGLDRELVEAVIHSFELDEREVSNSGFPYGLRLWFTFKNAYEYGKDPYATLNSDALFARLRDEVKAGPYLENLIRELLIENTHRCTLVITPDPELEARAEAAEKEKVAAIESKLTEEEKKRILETTTALKAEQETEQDLSVLPKISPSDISLDVDDPDLVVEEIGGATVGFYETATNGITYLTLSFDASGVEASEIEVLGMFADYLDSIGAGEHDHMRQALRIEKFTGGLNTGFANKPTIGGGDPNRRVAISTKTLTGDLTETFAIIRDIVSAPRFEIGRVKELLAMENASIDPRIVQLGQMYAAGLALSRLSKVGYLNFLTGGLGRLSTIRRHATGEASVDELVSRLSALPANVFRSSGLRMMITGDAEGIAAAKAELEDFVGALDSSEVAKVDVQIPSPDSKFDAYACAAPVNYNAKAWKTVSYEHDDAAPLAVLGYFLKSAFLHREIRERGGAYGSFAGANTREGLFTMWSYRDPHVERTFNTFDAAVEFAANGTHDPSDVEEAILQALKSMDPLLGPDAKGAKKFGDSGDGFTPEVRASMKRRLAAVTDEDLRRVAKQYLTGEASFGSVGSEPKLVEANEAMGGKFNIRHV